MRFKFKLAETLSVAALAVSIASAAFSYQQTVFSTNQLRLAQLQIRPYVKYMPEFIAEGDDGITVKMHSENQSAIPANVIYSQLTGWIDWESNGIFWYNNAEDILYQHKGGEQQLPPIQKKLAAAVLKGESVLMVGSCMVYGSISPSDTRRWEVKALYVFEPGEDYPTVQYTRENEVSTATNLCESKNIMDQWVADKADKLLHSRPRRLGHNSGDSAG